MTVAIRTKAELYERGAIKVAYSLPDYILSVGNSSIRLDPKTLEGLSMASPEEFEAQMRMLDPNFKRILGREGLTQEQLQLALAQASITDRKYRDQDSRIDTF